MQITTNKNLRLRWNAGLQIVGENYDKELEWIGTDEQWKIVDELEHKIDEMTENEVNEILAEN